MRLTVVVMAYNEAATLEATVGEIVATGCADDLLIVDDGSSDGTSAIADRLAREKPAVRVLHHGENAGLGAVYRSGFAEAQGELLTFFPADGQFPASIIPDFLARMHGCDLMLGLIDQPGRSAFGRFLSATERLVHRLLVGPMPPFQGIFMVRTAKLRSLPLVSTGRGWTIVMELIVRAKRAGWRIENRVTPFRPRQHGRSKVQNVRTVLSHVRQVLALRRAL